MSIKRSVTIIVAVVAVAVAGGLGGLLAFSYCAGLLPFFGGSVADLAPVQVTERHETVVQENKALKDAAAKVFGAVIGVKINSLKGPVFGSGVLLTSDGLAVVPYELFPPGAVAEVAVGGKKAAFEVLKRDKTANLAILKLENANWPTAGFYQLENLKLGERVFLAGVLNGGANFVNEGIVRDFTADIINTTIGETGGASGAAAFDIEGNILGIAAVSKTGQVTVIPISKIKEVSGL